MVLIKKKKVDFHGQASLLNKSREILLVKRACQVDKKNSAKVSLKSKVYTCANKTVPIFGEAPQCAQWQIESTHWSHFFLFLFFSCITILY